MALFTSQAVVGLDIGTSTLKLVELIDRKRSVEVATYAQANYINPLLEPTISTKEAVDRTANIVTRMLDAAGVSTDTVVAALPNSIVFSTVLQLPDLPEEDMDKAVRFAARDVVPANLDEMVLGWSRLGELPHLGEGKPKGASVEDAKAASVDLPPPANPATVVSDKPIPIFLTAAPKEIVNRYMRVIEALQLELLALEIETFSLVRSLLQPKDSAMIVDMGDQVTTFHIIDGGTVRVSHSVDVGGHTITQAVSDKLIMSMEKAEEEKVEEGLVELTAPAHASILKVTNQLLEQAEQLQDSYFSQTQRRMPKTVLIGGGANMRGLTQAWEATLKQPVTIGNPWKGLSYPIELEKRLQEVGSTYAVAVGLAQRGFGSL